MKSIKIILLILSYLLFSFGAALCSDDDVSVKTTSINFGQYEFSEVIPNVAFGYISIYNDDDQITLNVAIVKLDAGQHTGSISNFHPRKMEFEGNYLEYNIYTDPSCTKVWGDGTNNTFTQAGQNEITVYGKILPLQNVKAGHYTDSVTVTVEW